MRKTYFFRRYINRPKLFIDLGIPRVGARDEIEIINGDNGNFFINTNFVTENTIQTYTIKSHKQVVRSKLYIRNPQGDYIIPNFFQENLLNFFILDGEGNHKNCYIYSSKEGFNQLLNQANNPLLPETYLNLNNSKINLNNIIGRFDPINLIGIGFSIEGNDNLKSIKLKGNQGVTESKEAQQALKHGIIKYIEFSFGDINITLYDDFRLSFYSELDFETDITLINNIIEKYTLLS